MSEVAFVSNENNIDSVTTELSRMDEVSYDMWRDIQVVHVESLQAQLPRSEWYRIDDITHATDLATYRERRVHPNTQAGEDGWNREQIFPRPRIAISYDGSHQIVGSVITQNNTSGKSGASELRWKAEAGLKMLISPDFSVPKFGGRRYVHLREAFLHPDAQETVKVEDDVTVVSAITLTAIFRALDNYNPRQNVTAYLAEGDPADGDFAHLIQALGLSPTGDRENKLAGYTKAAREVRMQHRVIDVMRTINAIPAVSSDR